MTRVHKEERILITEPVLLHMTLPGHEVRSVIIRERSHRSDLAAIIRRSSLTVDGHLSVVQVR
jgi:hypothetical protein